MRLPWFEEVTDLAAGADVLRRRAYGTIEASDGQLRRVVLRPLPKVVSAPGVLLFGNWRHAHARGDRAWLYYNHPRRFPQFLALRYVVSARHTTFATLVRGLEVLDEIARLKRSDALLCDVGHWRISDRMMARFGWTPHCPARWHRHFIKRFYGQYPPRPEWLAAATAAV